MRRTTGICLFLAVMAISTARAVPASAASVDFLHSFAKRKNGEFPAGGLVKLGNAFYGTLGNGALKCKHANGCGAVFRVTANGHEKLIHEFDEADGFAPRGGLVAVGGVLYGTTSRGGPHNAGSIFSLTPQGSFSTLYSFNGAADGGDPIFTMLAVGNVLYGLTAGAGPNGGGTAFSITIAGTFSTLYGFGRPGDASQPNASLIAYQGLLYGVSYGGGASGTGTVFTLTPAGAETVLHSFAAGEGVAPAAALTSYNGLLYGTTLSGGTSNEGTIFSITPNGDFTTLYSAPDQKMTTGYNFGSNLVAIGGLLYGTTEGGGTTPDCYYCGTVFSITPGGVYTQLYVFPGTNSENYPSNPVIASDGIMYGETSFGAGSVFAFTP